MVDTVKTLGGGAARLAAAGFSPGASPLPAGL